MFGQVKPVVFDRYSRQRASWRPPRWLVLLLLGAISGAGGVLYVQQRVLPPRLSVEDSQRVQSAFDRADSERSGLQRELATLKRQFEVATAESRVSAYRKDLDTVATLQSEAHVAHGAYLTATEPLVAVQDTLDGTLVALLRDLENACGRAGIAGSLAGALGQAMDEIDEGASELLGEEPARRRSRG